MNKTVLLIGLGNMGTALARTLLGSGYETWVWNRTKEKVGTLLEAGALWSEDVWAAVGFVNSVVMCLSNYDNCVELLSTCSDLENKTLIQLTTGTASDANSFENLVKQKRGRYLDGVILAYPSNIGDPRCSLLVAGNSLAWKDSEALISELGGKSQYLGEEVGAPSHLDHALIAPSLMMQMAIIQGMHMAKTAGVDLEFYSTMISGLPISLKADQDRHTRAIIDGDFLNSGEYSDLERGFGPNTRRGQSVKSKYWIIIGHRRSFEKRPGPRRRRGRSSCFDKDNGLSPVAGRIS